MDSSKVQLPDERVSSAEGLAKVATELTDWEIKKIGYAFGQIQKTYMHKPNTAENLERLRDEALTKFADMNILASIDTAPCFYGEPPVLEIHGKIDNSQHDGLFDHEKKRDEVLKANQLGEDYRGQKESYKG